MTESSEFAKVASGRVSLGRGRRGKKKKPARDDDEFEDAAAVSDGDEEFVADEEVEEEKEGGEEEEELAGEAEDEDLEEDGPEEEMEVDQETPKPASTTVPGELPRRGRGRPRKSDKTVYAPRQKFVKKADRPVPNRTPVSKREEAMIESMKQKLDTALKAGWQTVVHPSFSASPARIRIDTNPEGVARSNVARFRFKGDAPEAVQTVVAFQGMWHGDTLAFNAGGPIWAMDWCPSGPASAETSQYIAISAHRTWEERHLIHANSSGPNFIQIWSVPTLKESATGPLKFEFGITHNGNTVWDMHWCPSGGVIAPDGAENPHGRIGLLACAMNDGSVPIYAVPNPRVLRANIGIQADAPFFLSLTPVAVAHRDTAHSSCVRWSWFSGHSMLLAGYSDGYVRVWSVSDMATPLFSCSSCINTVRGVQWSPFDEDIFAVSAWNKCSEFQVWSLHNPNHALQVMLPLGFSTPTRFVWNSMNTLIGASDNGRICSTYVFERTNLCMHRTHKLCVWDMATCLETVQSVSVGEDGLLCLAPGVRKRGTLRRYNLVKLEKASDGILVYDHTEQCIKGLEKHELTGAPEAALHRVCWNPDQSSSTWLAFGGSLGVAFIQNIACRERMIHW